MATEPPVGRSGPSPARAVPTVDARTLNRYPDVLQAAWGLSDAEFESVLRVHAGSMRQWRNHELCFASLSLTRLSRLFLFHESLRFGAQGHPPNFAAYIRRKWKSDDVVGGSTIIDVLSAADDEALEKIEQHFRGAG